jgi:hypothetical protein
MAERGAALVEMLIVTAISAVVWTAALAVIADLPARAAAWEEASAERQTARAIEARVARLAGGASPIEVDVEGAAVRVPPVWPRRLGLLRAGAPDAVSPGAVTIVSRTDGHRAVSMTGALPAAGGSVAFEPRAGCGSAAACGLRPGDLVLAIDRHAACGLFRVIAAGAGLDLDAVMSGVTLGSGSVIVPVSVDVIFFDPEESALRRYDGYRSDNIVADGIAAVTVAFRGASPLSLADGPFVGAGPMAFDADQLSITGIDVGLTPEPRAAGLPARIQLAWRVR